MFGFDPLSASSLLILAATSPNPAFTCAPHPPAQIRVVPRAETVKYEYDSTLKELQAYETDTIDPYSFHATTVTQGFMKGSIEPTLEVSIKQSNASAANTALPNNMVCIWYNEIEVGFHIDPTIFIAKELAENTCLRKAITEHEMKHVNVDRKIVNKYARTAGQKIYAELNARGYTVGPINEADVDEVAAKMRAIVAQVFDVEFQKMAIERRENQRAVDNLEEYESVNAKCPEFEKNKEKLYIQWLK